MLPARSDDKTPLFGIPRITSYPFNGSAAIVYWDGGNQTPPPPVTNIPNRGGADPHSFPRKTPPARQQKSDWFQPNGVLMDVCGGPPAARSTSAAESILKWITPREPAGYEAGSAGRGPGEERYCLLKVDCLGLRCPRCSPLVIDKLPL